MSVKIAEKIIQMNGQNYPLMDASAIEYIKADGTIVRIDKFLDNLQNITLKDYDKDTEYKKDDFVVLDNIIYKVLNDYTSYSIIDDISDGNLKQYVGNNNDGLSSVIEIANILTNTKIGGDQTVDSSILASDINDLKVNQLVYDTDGIIAKIHSIDNTNNTVMLKIIHSNPDTSDNTNIPEPSADGKLYFRSKEINATEGKWVEFTTVDGKTIDLSINK